MRAVLILALVGCNQMFGLDKTRQLDASHQYFDAPLDAAPACPPIGTMPRFSPLIHQDLLQSCYNYNFSVAANRAIATCYMPTGIATGPIDTPLMVASGIAAPDTSTQLSNPRLTPEADRVFLRAMNYTAMTMRLMAFAHQADDTWAPLPDLAIGAVYTDFPSYAGMTPAPETHLVVIVNYNLREYVANGSGWTLLTAYTSNDLGVIPYAATMTTDGLRLLIHGYTPSLGPDAGSGTAMFYSDRPSIDVRFTKAQRVESLPPDISDPFLTDDCARVYFSGFGSVFYIQQA